MQAHNELLVLNHLTFTQGEPDEVLHGVQVLGPVRKLHLLHHQDLGLHELAAVELWGGGSGCGSGGRVTSVSPAFLLETWERDSLSPLADPLVIGVELNVGVVDVIVGTAHI